MHACSLHVCNDVLHHLLFIVIYSRGSVMILCASNVVQTKIDLSSCLRHQFGYVLFYALKLPNGFQSVDR
jgi:hypothetical protein